MSSTTENSKSTVNSSVEDSSVERTSVEPSSRTSQKRRVLSLLVHDAAHAARRYVTNFRAGRGAE